MSAGDKSGFASIDFRIDPNRRSAANGTTLPKYGTAATVLAVVRIG
jgi:hypothetical protein